MSVLISLLLSLRTLARSRTALQLEVLGLRHQLQVLPRTPARRVRLATTDRCLWTMLSRLWTGWRTALVIVKPQTVIACTDGASDCGGPGGGVGATSGDHNGGRRDSHLDPHDGSGEPAVGRAADHGELLKLGLTFW